MEIKLLDNASDNGKTVKFDWRGTRSKTQDARHSILNLVIGAEQMTHHVDDMESWATEGQDDQNLGTCEALISEITASPGKGEIVRKQQKKILLFIK